VRFVSNLLDRCRPRDKKPLAQPRRRPTWACIRIEPLEDRRLLAFTLGINFDGSSLNIDSTFRPPDTEGAVGLDHYVELINGRFSVYDKSSGARVQTSTLDQFWTAAGVTTTSSFDPRVIFDHDSQRWFAVAVDDADSINNDIFVGVSSTSDPTNNWTAFSIDGDPANDRWADYPQLGVDAVGLYISANMFDIDSVGANNGPTTSIFSIPKADLVVGAGTIANLTAFRDLNQGTVGFTAHPVIDYGADDARGPFLSTDEGSDVIHRTNVVGAGAAGAVLGATTNINVAAFADPPDADQPGPKQDIDTGDSRLNSAAFEIGNQLWAAYSVSVGGRSAIRWHQIDETTNAVLQTGTISHPTLAYFYPSIAANEFGEVVIGFSGTSPAQFVSAFVAIGETAAGVTTFSDPIVTVTGTADYLGLVGTRNRWGDYSATSLDPANRRSFWTIQEYVSAADVWTTRITQIVFGIEPDQFEQNDTMDTATVLGSLPAITLRDLTIHDANDEDWFRYTAHDTGKLVVNALFDDDVGDIDLFIVDANGNQIASSTSTSDNEEVAIPVVSQQVYFIRITGFLDDINEYALEIENFAAPRPELVDLHPNDDNGVSNLDNVTDVDSPRILIQADLTEFVQVPVVASPISILTSAQAAAQLTAGAAVEVFVNGASVGFADALGTSTSLFQFTLLSTMLVDVLPVTGGFLDLVTAAVRIFDGQQNAAGAPAPATGRTLLSPPLALHWVDTHGPQITGVGITGSMFDLFDPKSGVNSPTPPINSLSITVQDLPARGPAFTHPALAAPVASVEPNSSIFSAQSLDRFFNLATDPNIGDQTQNTSTTTPHATVLGLSDGITFDYYSFTVDVANTTVVFDIDGAFNGGLQVNTEIFLYDATGIKLDENDDRSIAFGAGGSTSTFESYLEFTFLTPGVYTIGVAQTGSTGSLGGITGTPLPAGTTYTLHVSVPNHSVALHPGFFQLIGDNGGAAAIQRVEFVPAPIVPGQPATGTILIEFAQPLADDRYTLTVFDSLADPAGNRLDGESNASEPQGAPQFPTGDGVSGGNFVARFTVDSAPEIGVYIGTTVVIDMNGNGTFDPSNPDATNRDLVFEFGTISDQRLAGQLSPTRLPGFDVLIAFGRANAGAPYRFLVDVNGNGRFDPVVDPVVDPLEEFLAPPNLGGLAVAADFNPLHAGEELAIFDGDQWHIFGDGVENPVTQVLGTSLRGYPIAGDFNGDDVADLGTFQNNQFFLDFGPAFGSADLTINFGMPGTGDRPVAGDMNGDGIDDIGIWVPDAGAGQGTGEWRFLISSDPAGLNHAFSPAPLGHDVAFKFGDPRALPILGNFDPPVSFAASPTAAQAVVTALYHEILGRDPDPDGLATFVAQLQGGATEAQVAHALATSPENYGQMVDEYYSDYFNRAADGAGRQHWIDELLGGLPEDALAAKLLASAEYSKHYPTNAAFVDALYFDILGRAPDAGGRTTHLATLTSGQPRMRVIANLIESPERAQHVGRPDNLPEVEVAAPATSLGATQAEAIVVALYQDLLNRAPDAGGLSLFAGQLQAGITRQAVAQALMASREYLGRVVDRAYAQILNRPADAAGRQFWIGQMAAGASDDAVTTGLLQSNEYSLIHASNQAFVTALYQDLLGRTPDAAGLAHHVNLLVAGRPRGEIVGDLLGSQERANLVVQEAYVQVLDRPADPAGLATFASRLRSGELNNRALLAALIGSDEYLAMVLG